MGIPMGNSSNGRAIGAPFDKLVFVDLIEAIEILIEKRPSSKHSPFLGIVANTTELVLSSSNEREPSSFRRFKKQKYDSCMDKNI